MKRILAFASIALALSGQAFAADLYQPEPVAAPPAEPVVVASSGWYLRGDLSYDFMDMRGANYMRGTPQEKAWFKSADLDDTGNIGVGVGYQVNDYLRFDKTLDYMFSSDFRGSTTGGCGTVAGPCRSRDSASMSAYSLMANAYVDLAHYGAVTPYVGVGLGATRIQWDDLKNTSCSSSNPNACDPTVTHKGKDSWRFTYGLMAGAAIDVTCQLKADVGYRFRHVNDGPMFGSRYGAGNGRDEGFNIHEVRTGLRYSLDDSACQQAYMPPAELPNQPQPVFK
ncbi:porin family protein [Rhizobium sp. KVB221]|uniref:Porin family protein n=1 Tax=Rhizobium setariae TaxID=2801340 RepID=A0A936YTY6_9HYPH|nr:outer membrane protein [Rhizobium setariae]MBL0372450.1 porin family protein [Rhizobium setariae]